MVGNNRGSEISKSRTVERTGHQKVGQFLRYRATISKCTVDSRFDSRISDAPVISNKNRRAKRVVFSGRIACLDFHATPRSWTFDRRFFFRKISANQPGWSTRHAKDRPIDPKDSAGSRKTDSLESLCRVIARRKKEPARYICESFQRRWKAGDFLKRGENAVICWNARMSGYVCMYRVVHLSVHLKWTEMSMYECIQFI